MNQELLTGAIAFFKEQNGTYESMKDQMLAGGISLAEINQVYAEIQKLGLDPNGKYMKAMEKANPVAASKITIHPVSAEMPLTSKVSHTEMAHASYTATPQPTETETQAPVAVSPTPDIPITSPQVEPTPTNTLQGIASPDTPTTQMSTPPLPATAVPSSSHTLAVFITLFLLIGLSAGGVIAYTKYAPESALALMVSSTLQTFGLVPKEKVTPIQIEAATTTTQESTVQVSATVLATSTATTTVKVEPAQGSASSTVK